MKGVVEVYRGEEKILEESNMIMDNMGSQIAFWMSLPRGFGSIESASAIYDASNYTVRAASLGKDAAGYAHHAHRVDISDTSATNNIIRVYSYEGLETSAYRTEAFASYLINDNVSEIINEGLQNQQNIQLSSIKTRFKVLPQDSHPKMQRLEEASTKVPNIVAEVDLGQNLNYIFSVEALGCYAPSGNANSEVTFQILSSLPNGVAKTRVVVNNNGFNSVLGQASKAIDFAGYIRMNMSSITEGYDAEQNQHYYSGLILSYDTDTWNTAENTFEVKHVIGLDLADLLCLNFFGGVYTIGLWGFDVEGMLKKGKYPPYTNYPINSWSERAEYKLFARKTFNKDLTYYSNILDTNLGLVRIIWRFKFP